MPIEYQGDVMGDLNARRGRVQGAETAGDGEQTVSALVPTRRSCDTRSICGRSPWSRSRKASHDHYDVCVAPRRQGQAQTRNKTDGCAECGFSYEVPRKDDAPNALRAFGKRYRIR